MSAAGHCKGSECQVAVAYSLDLSQEWAATDLADVADLRAVEPTAGRMGVDMEEQAAPSLGLADCTEVIPESTALVDVLGLDYMNLEQSVCRSPNGHPALQTGIDFARGTHVPDHIVHVPVLVLADHLAGLACMDLGPAPALCTWTCCPLAESHAMLSAKLEHLEVEGRILQPMGSCWREHRIERLGQ